MYKVIVVEDGIVVRRGIILTIDWAALGCVIAGGAASGEERAELAVRLSPGIIVTDVRMFRMGGVEVTTKLWEQGCRAKFIILTVYSDFKYAQSTLRLGASDYLLKPLRDGDLEHTVGYIKEQAKECPPREEETDAAPVLRLRSDKKFKDKYVEAITRYIKEHYQEDITISTTAPLLEISEGCLGGVSKKGTDHVFTNYLVYYRIQTAMNLLKDRRVKVHEVTDQVERSDTAYFSTQFKRILGISPSEHQDRCR